MTTVREIVTDAMYEAGILGADSALSAEDAQLALRIFNRYLDSAANFRALCNQVLSDTFTMTPSLATYSTALLTVMGRPTQVDEIFVTTSNINWPVRMIDAGYWADIPYKVVDAIPEVCFSDGAVPNATLSFYPRPYTAFVCTVMETRGLPATVTLDTSLSVPKGYERFFVLALALEMCPSWKRKPQELTLQRMRHAQTAIETANFVPLIAENALFPRNRGNPSQGFLYRGF